MRRIRRLYSRPSQTDYIQKAFASAPVFDTIFSCLDAGDIIRLSKTCRGSRDAVRSFMSRAYNIDRHLSRYFSNPDEFRYLQARTGTLISGSNALQFLDRTFYPASDLDLYVTRPHTEELGAWLLAEGYSFVPSESNEDFATGIAKLSDELEDDYVKGSHYRTTGISDVFEFRKGDRVVQVIAAKHSTFHAIISFHNTCVMNFITYEAAYSLYPKATFDARFALANGSMTAKELRALTKYKNRGWTITLSISWPYSPDKMKKLFHTDKARWTLDRHTWRFPLKELSFPPRKFTSLSPELDFDPVIANSWGLLHNSEFTTTFGHFIVSKLLKYRYMCAEPDSFQAVLNFLKVQGAFDFERMEMELEEVTAGPEWDKLWVWWDAALPTIFSENFNGNNNATSRSPIG